MIVIYDRNMFIAQATGRNWLSARTIKIRFKPDVEGTRFTSLNGFRWTDDFHNSRVFEELLWITLQFTQEAECPPFLF